jgi:hypothetical protein
VSVITAFAKSARTLSAMLVKKITLAEVSGVVVFVVTRVIE